MMMIEATQRVITVAIQPGFRVAVNVPPVHNLCVNGG
jgi:hypothetical protein